MERQHPPASHRELELGRLESDTQLIGPERGTPAIVVAADHGHRQVPRQPSQCGGHPESVTRDDPTICEPELEEVAVDQQRITQIGHSIEKIEQRPLGLARRVSEVGVRHDDERFCRHARKHADGPMSRQAGSTHVSETTVRVNYSETDQMGVAYHARYLVWFDVARCDYLRATGLTYRELEEQGMRLVVCDVNVRYRRPARYDDLIRVRCWVRELASRRVTFGYAVERDADGELLATATTSLLSLDSSLALCRMPEDVAQRLVPVPDPVKL
jgi:acyl-CoA thioester hydrolase